jgi:hypothetical protein
VEYQQRQALEGNRASLQREQGTLGVAEGIDGQKPKNTHCFRGFQTVAEWRVGQAACRAVDPQKNVDIAAAKRTVTLNHPAHPPKRKTAKRTDHQAHRTLKPRRRIPKD